MSDAECPGCRRLRLKLAAVRADRNAWRALCIRMHAIYRTLRGVITEV